MTESSPSSPQPQDLAFPFSSYAVPRPTLATWAKHFALLLCTVFTTTLGGVTLLHGDRIYQNVPDPVRAIDYVKYLPEFYLKSVASLFEVTFTHPRMLVDGLLFSLCLLAILGVHEAGHYIACRYYRVDATLPFFLPSIPLLGPGTFGAFIKIRSPIWSRRALFDIGVAGPIAGFIVVIPIAVIAVLTMGPAPVVTDAAPVDAIVFNPPLLMRLIGELTHTDYGRVEHNAFFYAAWLGLLVTSLNLIPVGQLDGGHATYSIFGPVGHKWLGRAAFIAVLSCTLLGWFLFQSPSGFFYTILLAVMLRVRHQHPETWMPLGRARIGVAIITLLVFVLSFYPFPIAIK